MKKSSIVKSLDVPKHISPKDPCACTERAMARMPQIGASRPPILVMLVSESVAEVLGVGHTGVIRHSRSAADPPSYYEVWLVGQAGIANYVPALQGIMNDFRDRSASTELDMSA
jgi:hypothetical protein